MTLFRYILSLALFAMTLSGCVDLANENKSTRQEMPVKKLSDIHGEWDIIRFDDYHPPRQNVHGINHANVTFSNKSVGFRMECNGAGMPAKLTYKGILKNRSIHRGIVRTLMGCPEEIAKREEMLVRFFADRPRVTKLSPTQLRLATNAHELIIQKKND